MMSIKSNWYCNPWPKIIFKMKSVLDTLTLLALCVWMSFMDSTSAFPTVISNVHSSGRSNEEKGPAYSCGQALKENIQRGLEKAHIHATYTWTSNSRKSNFETFLEIIGIWHVQFTALIEFRTPVWNCILPEGTGPRCMCWKWKWEMDAATSVEFPLLWFLGVATEGLNCVKALLVSSYIQLCKQIISCVKVITNAHTVATC